MRQMLAVVSERHGNARRALAKNRSHHCIRKAQSVSGGASVAVWYRIPQTTRMGPFGSSDNPDGPIRGALGTQRRRCAAAVGMSSATEKAPEVGFGKGHAFVVRVVLDVYEKVPRGKIVGRILRGFRSRRSLVAATAPQAVSQ
jgi:hypothetical protein